MIALDLETSGLNWRKDRIIGIATYNGQDAIFSQLLPDALTIYDFVLHNAKFDLKFLRHNGCSLSGRIDDTMLMSYVLNPEREGGHSLANLTKTILGRDHYEISDLLGKGKTKRRMEDLTFEELAEKSKMDVKDTYDLFFALKEQMTPDLWRLYEKIELKLMLALVDIEMRGIDLDVKYLQQLEQETRQEMAQALRQVRKWPHINYNSPKQVGDLLYKKLKLPKCKVTDKGQPSTDTETLGQLAHPFAKQLIAYRDVKKRLSTYVEPLLEEANTNAGKLFPNFNQALTATGRLSSSNPINLQNIPTRSESGRKIRGAIIPTTNKILVEADYAQIEPRLMAHFSNDNNLIKLFRQEMDLYTGVVQEVLYGGLQAKEKEAKEKRALGKLLFLAMGYGAQPKKLVKAAKISGVTISEQEAQDFIDKASCTYSTLFQFKENVVQKARREGKVTTICGRVRYFPKMNDPDRWVRMEQERQAFNTLIQGSAADLMKIALIKLYEAKFKLLLTVHDSVLIEIPSLDGADLAVSDPLFEQRYIDYIEQIMESVGSKLRVPLKVETTIQDRWGHNNAI